MSTKPLPRKTRIVNRGYQYSRSKKDNVKNISVTLNDIDSAVIYYINNVIHKYMLNLELEQEQRNFD